MSHHLLPLGLTWLAALLATASSAAEPRFNRDIRPILSDLCFHCHGPDKNQRKADLRLDDETSVIGVKGQPGVVHRGKPESSELLRRLTSTDPDERMPPPDAGRQATPAQIELMRQWIAAGAPWEGHWAFQPVKRPASPSASASTSQAQPATAPRSPLDQFVQAELAARGLTAAPEAARESLLRRVALDLTGLPPSLDQIDEFLTETSPDAFARQVDRLIASPRYGERLGARWLDAARYADTSGYQSDGPRYMWRWRDWVLESLNQDLPFDRFTVEQLAGDLLPNATLSQRIATGFNRNHRGNSEGGIIAEEYAVEYVVDRVDTTATVWLGLTMGCARCHDHKFDPVSQLDYYGLFAYFNNIPEYGRAIKEGNSPPYLKAPTFLEQEQLNQLDERLRAAAALVLRQQPDLEAAQMAWERTASEQPLAVIPEKDRPGFSSDGLVARFALDGGMHAAGEKAEPPASSGSAKLAARDGEVEFEPGIIGQAGRFLGKASLDAGDTAGFGYFEPFTISLWVKPVAGRDGTLVSKMSDMERGDGYSIILSRGAVQLNFVKRWLDDALRLESKTKLKPDVWQHLLMVYDGTRNAAGVRLYVDGEPSPLQVQLDALNQTFITKEPLRIGGGGGPSGRFTGLIDEVRIYRGAHDDRAARLAARETLDEILRIPAERRTEGQRGKLADYFLAQHAPARFREAIAARDALASERDSLFQKISTVMVMEELPTPRATFVLRRGEYDKPDERVERGVPASLGRLPHGAPNDRLGLARWIVDPANPLTARVTVNRLWQAFFGAGIVRTVEDFGSQGQPPSHPDLLDWLAAEFQGRTSGGEASNEAVSGKTASDSAAGSRDTDAAKGPNSWSLKRVIREIVLSHTYRQSSRATREQLAADPDNRWHSRGPRFRLPAEMIRDQALAASGLLVERVGGPSVKPYQPADLWKELATDSVYDQGHGADLYRRTIYTFWKRTVAPPTLVTFDAAGREACIVRETRTNTPLQALALLNEVTFVEASRQLAERTLREVAGADDGSSTASDERRIVHLFRLVTSRRPAPREIEVLMAGLKAHRQRYTNDATVAEKLLTAGESPADRRWPAHELAAWTAVAGVVLNLDETVTKD
ncbi:MAG: DUF1553 domain-containing protein [Pirellulales bacterium]